VRERERLKLHNKNRKTASVIKIARNRTPLTIHIRTYMYMRTRICVRWKRVGVISRIRCSYFNICSVGVVKRVTIYEHAMAYMTNNYNRHSAEWESKENDFKVWTLGNKFFLTIIFLKIWIFNLKKKILFFSHNCYQVTAHGSQLKERMNEWEKNTYTVHHKVMAFFFSFFGMIIFHYDHVHLWRIFHYFFTPYTYPFMYACVQTNK
jgi:hypothetical protein